MRIGIVPGSRRYAASGADPLDAQLGGAAHFAQLLAKPHPLLGGQEVSPGDRHEEAMSAAAR